MNRHLVPAALLMGLSLCVLLVADEPREWTDSTGRFKTLAEFVSLDDETVTLRQPGTGKEIKLPLARLSDDDQDYIEQLLQQRDEDQDQSSPRRPPAATPGAPDRGSTPSSAAAGRRTPNNVINSVRGAVFRAETRNNLRQIGAALVAYESSRGYFPPAAIAKPDGKPLLSWRVAILPMLELEGLYRQFKLDEPWDSDHNKALIAQMPSIYQSPGSDLDEGSTNYLAVVSPDTILGPGRRGRGTRTTDVRDGLSRTAMVVEADDTYAAIWTQPSEYDWDPMNPAYGLGGIWPGFFFAVCGDGNVDQVDLSLGADAINALFSRSGGEVIP